MSKYNGIEIEALLAAQARDDEYLDQLMSKMTYNELRELEIVAFRLYSMLRAARKSMRRTAETATTGDYF